MRNSLFLVWRWSQLIIAVIMVFLEWFVRQVLSITFRVVPIPLVLDTLGLSRREGSSCKSEEEILMDCGSIELIKSKGYPVEEHFATTSDGYILGLHRIPFQSSANDGAGASEDQQQDQRKGVVLFIHGFMQSSEAFLARTQSNNCLPFVLSDAGYDVWLGNNRGNKYSFKHVSKKPTQDEFWDFSLDEMIRYDVPTLINHVLAQTGATKLTLVGFSQGTAQSFACLSSNPAIAEKVNLFVALAPVTFVKRFKNAIVDSLARARPDFIFLLFGKRQILPSALMWRRIFTRSQFVKAIDMSINFLFGWEAKCLDPVEKALLYSHLYAYSSVKSVVHWFQIIQTGRFQMFDDSLTTVNPDHYAGHEVPTYQPSQIGCPVACFCGTKDSLPNTPAILAQIPKDRLVFVHEEAEYEHLDFMYAKDAGQKIYPKILKLVDTYSQACREC